MYISKIVFNNFRIYKGVNEIHFSPREDKNISVICGRNGYGKTTFLMGLVWCLYGRNMEEVDDFYKKEIKENGGYKSYIANSLNTLAKKDGESSFGVSITLKGVKIPTVSCEEIEIIRNFNIKNPKDEDPVIYIDGDKNELTESGEYGNQLFIQELILPKEIAKFFFFDAEKIVTLATELNKTETRKNLSKAYSEVLGIKKFNDLKERLEDVLGEIKKESASIDEIKHLDRLTAEINEYEIDLEAAQKKIIELDEEKSGIQFEVSQLQEKLIRSDNKITIEELESLRQQKQKLEEEFNTSKGELKTLFEIIPFAIAGGKLFEVFDQVLIEDEYRKWENNMNDSKEKIDTILTNFERDISVNSINDVIIHRDIKKFFIEKLEINLRHFLGLGNYEIEKAERKKSLHDFSSSEKNELEALLGNLSSNYKNTFTNITKNYTRTRNEHNSITKKLNQAESNEEKPIIAEYRKQKLDLEIRLEHIDKEIMLLTEDIGKYKVQKTSTLRKKNDLSQKIQTSEKNKEKSELIEKLIKVLNNFIKSFKESKKKSLEDQILDCLNKFMHKRSFIKNVQIDIMPNDIIDINLYDQLDEREVLGQFSMGEKQLFATALLQGLVEESTIDFPVFIDSPMQKLDDEHSKNIIKYFYPNVSNQVVLLPLPIKEMTETEFDSLKQYVNTCYIINNTGGKFSGFVQVENDDLFSTFKKLNNEPNV